MRRQIASALALLVGIALIIALSRDLVKLLSARGRLVREQNEVQKLEQEQQELAQKLGDVMSEEFVEKEAREKLLMGKPGEVVVLLPPEERTGEGGVASTKSDLASGEAEELANWKKWAQLFGFFK